MSAQEAYELGLRYLKNGSYTKALEQLNRVRTYYRDDPYALKAELAIADVQFKKNEWDSARVAYDEFQRAHPRYRDLDYVVYRLGLTLYRKAPTVAARDQTWTRQAVDTWTRFGARFPESDWRRVGAAAPARVRSAESASIRTKGTSPRVSSASAGSARARRQCGPTPGQARTASA